MTNTITNAVNRNAASYNAAIETSKNGAQDHERYEGIASQFYKNRKEMMANSLQAAEKMYTKRSGGRRRTSTTDLSNPRMFNQLMIMDRQTYAQIQTFIGGRFFLIPGGMPRFMEDLFPEETEYMRLVFQTSVKSINGFVDKTLEFTTITALTEQNNYEVVTKQTGKTTSLTLSFIALKSGLPEFRYFTLWMDSIYDPGSSAAIYPALTGLEYHEGNHSMDAIYIIPDPSFQTVEQAVIINGMVPKTNSASSIFNQTWSEHNAVEYSIEFKVHTTPMNMPNVLNIAQGVLLDLVSQIELSSYEVKPVNNPAYMGLGKDIGLSEAAQEEIRNMGGTI